MIDDSKPIFVQIAEMIENDIVDGILVEETQAPSTNEFAAFHRINPATAAKGVNRLVDDGILYKKRGIGMFVATGARAVLVGRRREDFYEQFLAPLAREARKLGIDGAQLADMLAREAAAVASGVGASAGGPTGVAAGETERTREGAL